MGMLFVNKWNNQVMIDISKETQFFEVQGL